MALLDICVAFVGHDHDPLYGEMPWDPTVAEVAALLLTCACLLVTFIACVWLELGYEPLRLFLHARPAERYPTAAGSYRFTPVAGVDGVEWVRDDGMPSGVTDESEGALRVESLLFEHAGPIDDETYVLLLDRIHRMLPADVVVVWTAEGVVLWCSRSALAYGIAPGPGGLGAHLRPAAQAEVCGLVTTTHPFLAHHAPVLGPCGLARMLIAHRARFEGSSLRFVVTRGYRAEELADRGLGLVGATA